MWLAERVDVMEQALIVLGTMAGVIGTGIGAWALLRARRRENAQVPQLQCDAVAVLSSEPMDADGRTADPIGIGPENLEPRNVGPLPTGVAMTVTNQGESSAKDIRVEGRLFVVLDDAFTVPPDDQVVPHFGAHLDALGAGGSVRLVAYARTAAVEAGLIPRLDPEAVLVVKATFSFSDSLGKQYTNRQVVAALPPGSVLRSYDHSDPDEQPA